MRATVNRCVKIRYVPLGIQMIRNHHNRGRKRKHPKSPRGKKIIKKFRIFSVCALQYIMQPQLQSRCHYIVNHYLKIWHVRLGYANKMQRSKV